VGAVPNANLVSMVAKNLEIDVSKWHVYSARLTTRWEHFKGLYEFFDLTPFTTVYQERVIEHLTELTTRTDKGIELARAMVAWLRQEGILVPSISVIERVCIKSLTAGRKRVYSTLTNALTKDQKTALTSLLDPHDETHTSTLVWLRQPMPASVAIPVIVCGTIVISLLVAVFVFQEQLEWQQLTGVGLLIVGMLLLFTK